MGSTVNTINEVNLAPGKVTFASNIKRVVIAPSLAGPLYLRAWKKKAKTPWFSLFPDESNGQPPEDYPAQQLLQAKMDVDTLLIPTGADSVEVWTPHNDGTYSLAAWSTLSTAEAINAPFERKPKSRFLPVPFRSQMVEKAVAPNRICLPTSLAMVLHYHGVNKTTATIARRTYDKHHKIYGNWVKACLAAQSCSFKARIVAMDKLSEILPFLDRGLPLIVSVGYEKGELPGSPIERTNGHLVVVCGVDEEGNLICRDPAAKTRKKGEVTYEQRAFAAAWKGVAIVVEPFSS